MMAAGSSVASSFLEFCSVTEPVSAKYTNELQGFLNFATTEKLPLTGDSEVDDALTRYLNSLYMMGWPCHRAEKILASFMFTFQDFSRNGTRRMPRTWRSLKGWKKLDPGQSRAPEPWSLWCAYACLLSQLGCAEMAVALLLMVVAYLRPCELMSLHVVDLLTPAISISPFWTLLICPSTRSSRTKVGESDDSIRLDAKRLLWVDRVLKILKLRPQGLLWSFDYAQFCSMMKRVNALTGLKVVPYQGRHSGPSIDRAENVRTQEEVQKRGRWKSHRSLIRYEKHGRLQLSYNQKPRSMRALLDWCETHVEAVVLGTETLPHALLQSLEASSM
jgi:integrase